MDIEQATKTIDSALKFAFNVPYDKFAEVLEKMTGSKPTERYAEEKFRQMRENFISFYCNLDDDSKRVFAEAVEERYGKATPKTGKATPSKKAKEYVHILSIYHEGDDFCHMEAFRTKEALLQYLRNEVRGIWEEMHYEDLSDADVDELNAEQDKAVNDILARSIYKGRGGDDYLYDVRQVMDEAIE